MSAGSRIVIPGGSRVVAVAVAIRVIVLILAYLSAGSIAWFYTPDSFRYVAAGESLATSGQLTFEGAPEVLRLPGYPLLLAIARSTGHRTIATVSMQIVLAASTVWLTYRCGALAGDESLARRAGYLAAVEPSLVLYTGLVMTETMFTWLVAWSVYRCILAERRGQFAVAGLLAGLAALVRPLGLFLPIVLAAGVIAARRTADLRPRLAAAAVILLSSAIVVSAWCVRNGIVANYWGYASQVDRRLLLTEAAADMAARQGRDLREVVEETRASLHAAQPAGAGQREGAVALRARHEGLRYVRAHWAGVVWQHLRGSVMSLLHPPGGEANPLVSTSPQASVTYHLLAGNFREAGLGLSQADGRLTVWRLIRSLYWGTALVLIGGGALSLVGRAARARSGNSSVPHLWPVISAVVLYLFVAAGTPYASSRFRHPLMPFLCLTAAVGVGALRRRNV